MGIVNGMAGGQVLIWIPLLDEGSCVARPAIVPVAVEIVSEVPGDVREGAKPRDVMIDPISLEHERSQARVPMNQQFSQTQQDRRYFFCTQKNR